MKLWILRHAKAEAHSATGRDQDRPLAQAGQRASRALNRWLADSGPVLPEVILVSPATRTRQTATLALAGIDGPEAGLCDALWMASTRELAELIETQGAAGTDSLMLIGHNPGLEDLVMRLGGRLPVHGLKPGTLVVMEVALPLKPGSAETLQLVEARELT
jgi:phosphohistidine phosphatase